MAVSVGGLGMKERGQDSENMEAWRRTLPELEPNPLRRSHSLLLMVQELEGRARSWDSDL